MPRYRHIAAPTPAPCPFLAPRPVRMTRRKGCMLARTFLLCATLVGSGLYASPYVPEDDAVVLQVAASDDHALRELRSLRDQLENTPVAQRLPLALRYAQATIEYARRTQDPRWYGYAEAALAPWWSQPDPPPAVRVLRATIAQHRHAFDAALQDLDAVLTAQPSNVQARVTRAVIHAVQANYAQAIADCRELAVVSALLSVTCAATPKSLTQAPAKVLDALDRLLLLQSGSSGVRLWALTVRAEIAERVGLEETDALYREALDAPDAEADAYLHLAYADYLLDAGRPTDAREAVAPFADTDAGLLRMFIANQALARNTQSSNALADTIADQQATLQARFAAARARGGIPHHREEAMLALHVEGEAQRALFLARENWRIQREPLDARLLLASALAAGDAAAAEPVLTWRERHGIHDHRLQALAQQLHALDDKRSSDQ